MSREFWIDEMTVRYGHGEAQSKKNYHFTGGVKVVESSALESVKRELEEAKAMIARRNEVLSEYEKERRENEAKLKIAVEALEKIQDEADEDCSPILIQCLTQETLKKLRGCE